MSHLKYYLASLVVIHCVLSLCWAQERTVIVGTDILRYTPQPELGYIVKFSEKSTQIKSLNRVDLFKPIAGSNRHGVWVVSNGSTANQNEQAIIELKKLREVTYVAPLFTSNNQTVAIGPEIVVCVRPGISQEQLESICQDIGCTVNKPMDFTEREYILDVLGADANAVFEALEKLNELSIFEWAAPNQAIRPRSCDIVLPNDEYFPEQWHLYNTGQFFGTPDADINAPEAWELETGDPNIVIAVLDTGIDSNHPDLIENLVPGYDFYEGDDSPEPGSDGHGTSVAGIIAASINNGIGVAGVMWQCSIMPVRTNIWADWGLVPESEVATAIRWAAVNGADIMNNSWAENIPIPIVHSAIIDVTKPGGLGREGKGCVFLVSSGNEYGPIYWPALYPETITVGATTPRDERSGFSSYGPELDIVAPGQTIYTTDITDPEGPTRGYINGDYYPWFAGTSASCPVASGVAGLILSVDLNLTNEEVRLILRQSAHDLGQPGRDDEYGWGRVDARAAVEMTIAGIQIWYVDDDGLNDPGPGDPNISDPNEDGSIEHPFDAIQEAIATAIDAETIVVLPGRYTGSGNYEIDFLGKAVTVRSEGDPANCIIDGQEQGRMINFQSGESRRAVLEGFTIMGGIASQGGGVYINDSSPTIRHCVFRNNQALLTGGGLHARGQSEPMIENCIFVWNSGVATGGAIDIESGSAEIRNCTLVRNKASVGGIGLNVGEQALVTLTNSIVWDNGQVPILGEPIVSFSDIQHGWPGTGNIDTDPLFADPDTGNFHLMSQAGRWDPTLKTWVQDNQTSPCIDAGDPNTPIGQEPTPNGNTINQGAHGGTAQASHSDRLLMIDY